VLHILPRFPKAKSKATLKDGILKLTLPKIATQVEVSMAWAWGKVLWVKMPRHCWRNQDVRSYL
jgi:hypothetical protein